MSRILVDADACPVKEEIYRLAARNDLKVHLVTGRPLFVPPRVAGNGRVEVVRVPQRLDAADDWIAEQAGDDDIVVTADIPLAARCLKSGARVLTHVGREFTEESIGSALAARDLMDQLRQAGMPTDGPAPFGPSDRARFTARLAEIIQSIRLRAARSSPRA